MLLDSELSEIRDRERGWAEAMAERGTRTGQVADVGTEGRRVSVRFGCQLCFGQRSSLFLIQAREAVPHVAEFGEPGPTPTESELQLKVLCSSSS